MKRFFPYKMSKDNVPCFMTKKQLPPQFEMYSHIIFSSLQFSIGRALSNLFVLADISISRTHCMLNKQLDDSWVIQDLSSFGSLLNGSKMEKGESYNLKNNDLIQLDPNGEFVYIFCEHCDHDKNSFKRRRLGNTDSLEVYGIEHTKQKFEDTQNIEVENMESKIRNAKLRSENSLAEREHLKNVLQKEIRNLNYRYSTEIENLKGEKAEVERQKMNLEEQRKLEIQQYEETFKSKITLLKETISQQKENEEKLQLENKELSERLQQERVEFEKLLAEENMSSKEMLNKLEMRLQQQEDQRSKEKEQLDLDKKQMEILKASMEKEVKELEEKMKQTVEAREVEIMNLQKEIEKKAVENDEAKMKTEEKYMNKLEEMQSVTELLRTQVNQIDTIKIEIETLQHEKRNIESKLLENTATSNATVKQLEAELIKVRNELDTVECKRLVLEENLEKTQNQSGTVDINNFIERQNVLTEFNQLMESELQCTICADLLIAATTLNCSHTFCKYCIEQWKKKKKECPICRSPIVSQCRSLMFDSFICKMVENLAPDVKEKRQQILREREELERKTNEEEENPTQNRRRGSSSSSFEVSRYSFSYDGWEGEEYSSDNSYGRGFDPESEHMGTSDTGGSDSENEDVEEEQYSNGSDNEGISNDNRSHHESTTRESANDDTSNTAGPSDSRQRQSSSRSTSGQSTSSTSNNSMESETITGLSGVYYGGYGHCFNCGARGHWAPGCPF